MKPNYNKLSDLMKKSYPGKSKREIQSLVNAEWSAVKKDKEAFALSLKKIQLRIDRVVDRKNDL